MKEGNGGEKKRTFPPILLVPIINPPFADVRVFGVFPGIVASARGNL